MNQEEFASLPPAIMAKVLWPLVGAKLADVVAPEAPRSPKFDTRIRRRDGYCYASELDAEGLRFWMNKAAEPGDPKYAEKNEKQRKALEFFLRWRQCFPNALWSGERGPGEVVTAKPPSGKPEIYQWEERDSPPKSSSSAKKSSGGGGYGSTDYGSGGDDDSIPFILNALSLDGEAWWKRTVLSAD